MPEDEHARYEAYRRAVDRRECHGPLLDCLKGEPEVALATSVLAALMEGLEPVDRSGLLDIAPVDGLDFLVQRAEDLNLSDHVTATEQVGDDELGRLLESSDWLQRRVVERTNSLGVLMVLAERARTRRVRARAMARVRSLPS